MNKKCFMGNIKLLLTYTKTIFVEHGFSKSRSFFLRSILFSNNSFKWINFIDGYYKKLGLQNVPWSLTGLITRSYAASNYGMSKKISLLINHYGILSEILNHDILKKILQGDKITITTLIGKDGSSYSFNLGILPRYWREGGLTIFMSDEEGNVLTTTTFNFGKKKNGPRFILISGLQGTKLGKEKIVTATRMLNGLRPKYAVIESLYAIAVVFKIDQIIAVSFKNHVYKNTKMIDMIHSDYNEFWAEIGGTVDKDGNFQLPNSLPKRSIEDVPSKKKKDWLKRQEYLEQIKNDSKNIHKF